MSEQDRLVESSSVPSVTELSSPPTNSEPSETPPAESSNGSPDGAGLDVYESGDLLTTQEAADIFDRARDDLGESGSKSIEGPSDQHVVSPIATAPAISEDPERLPPLPVCKPAADKVAEPAPSLPTVLNAIRGLEEIVGNRFDVIQSMVERELRAEMTRERVVDRLHAELQEYKQDMLLKVLRPVFVDLIQLHDDIDKMMDSYRKVVGEACSSSDRTIDLLENVRTGIEDILYRQGVEPFEHADSTFDARRQRAVSTVPTEDAELNKTVAARIRKGFQSGDKVIRPEIVSVYTLKK